MLKRLASSDETLANVFWLVFLGFVVRSLFL